MPTNVVPHYSESSIIHNRYTLSEIKAGSELFIYYGDGYAEARDYAVADDCEWVQTDDSYDSDTSQ